MTPEQQERDRELRAAIFTPPTRVKKPIPAVPEIKRACPLCNHGLAVVGHRCWDFCGVQLRNGQRCTEVRWSVITTVAADGGTMGQLLPCFNADAHARAA
jgi:hypothetical protein